MSRTVEPNPVLTYAKPQRKRLRTFWAGILFIGFNVGSYILDTYSLRPKVSFKDWLSAFNPEVMLELFTPLALAAAMFVLLLYWQPDESRTLRT